MQHIGLLNRSTDTVALAAASAAHIVDGIQRINHISLKRLDELISDKIANCADIQVYVARRVNAFCRPGVQRANAPRRGVGSRRLEVQKAKRPVDSKRSFWKPH
jgi:hypothetical protein